MPEVAAIGIVYWKDRNMVDTHWFRLVLNENDARRMGKKEYKAVMSWLRRYCRRITKMMREEECRK